MLETRSDPRLANLWDERKAADKSEPERLLYRSNLNNSQALEAIEEEIPASPELEHLIAFIRSTREGYGGRGNNPTPT